VAKTSDRRGQRAQRRNCPTPVVARELIDEVVAGYRTIYRLALEGLDRSRADKVIRTVTDLSILGALFVFWYAFL